MFDCFMVGSAMRATVSSLYLKHELKSTIFDGYMVYSAVRAGQRFGPVFHVETLTLGTLLYHHIICSTRLVYNI